MVDGAQVGEQAAGQGRVGEVACPPASAGRHFGRAAEALHIAQPVLSRQIKTLEDELKVQLFVRDKRATELTPAGRQLLADAGPLLASADALRRRVSRAARALAPSPSGSCPA